MIPRAIAAIVVVALMLFGAELVLRRYTDVGSPLLIMGAGAVVIAALVVFLRKSRAPVVKLKKQD
jgi:hypothetical protein